MVRGSAMRRMGTQARATVMSAWRQSRQGARSRLSLGFQKRVMRVRGTSRWFGFDFLTGGRRPWNSDYVRIRRSQAPTGKGLAAAGSQSDRLPSYHCSDYSTAAQPAVIDAPATSSTADASMVPASISPPIPTGGSSMLSSIRQLVVCFAILGNLVAATAASAQAPVHFWSQRFGANPDDIGYAVAVDGSGNVVMTGYFNGTVNFGGSNLVSSGGNDIFVAKYNSAGIHQWSQRFGSTTNDEGRAVAVDGSGNIFVTGYFTGAISFTGSGLISAGGNDIFVTVSYTHLRAHET